MTRGIPAAPRGGRYSWAALKLIEPHLEDRADTVSDVAVEPIESFHRIEGHTEPFCIFLVSEPDNQVDESVGDRGAVAEQRHGQRS